MALFCTRSVTSSLYRACCTYVLIKYFMNEMSYKREREMDQYQLKSQENIVISFLLLSITLNFL